MAGTNSRLGRTTRALVMRRVRVESMLIKLASLVSNRLRQLTFGTKVRHALDVRGLGKHVQRNNLRHFKDTFGAQNVQVPSHSGRMTGNIDDLRGSRVAQELQQCGLAAFA